MQSMHILRGIRSPWNHSHNRSNRHCFPPPVSSCLSVIPPSDTGQPFTHFLSLYVSLHFLELCVQGTMSKYLLRWLSMSSFTKYNWDSFISKCWHVTYDRHGVTNCLLNGQETFRLLSVFDTEHTELRGSLHVDLCPHLPSVSHHHNAWRNGWSMADLCLTYYRSSMWPSKMAVPSCSPAHITLYIQNTRAVNLKILPILMTVQWHAVILIYTKTVTEYK